MKSLNTAHGTKFMYCLEIPLSNRVACVPLGFMRTVWDLTFTIVVFGHVSPVDN